MIPGRQLATPKHCEAVRSLEGATQWAQRCALHAVFCQRRRSNRNGVPGRPVGQCFWSNGLSNSMGQQMFKAVLGLRQRGWCPPRPAPCRDIWHLAAASGALPQRLASCRSVWRLPAAPGALPQRLAPFRIIWRLAATSGALPQRLAPCRGVCRLAASSGALPQHLAPCLSVWRKASERRHWHIGESFRVGRPRGKTP